VPLRLLVRFDRLVEALVVHARLLLLEGLHLLLLLEEPRLHLAHVLVRLQHLREEVVRARNGYLALHEDLHALHDVLSGHVVEGDLPLNVIMHVQCLGYDQWLVICYRDYSSRRCLLMVMCSLNGMRPFAAFTSFWELRRL
jgi:hypothetical protein